MKVFKWLGSFERLQIDHGDYDWARYFGEEGFNFGHAGDTAEKTQTRSAYAWHAGTGGKKSNLDDGAIGTGIIALIYT